MCKIQWPPLEDAGKPTHSENWSRERKKQAFHSVFLIGYLRLIVDEEKFFFIEEFYLINTEGITEMEHHHIASPYEIKLDNMVIKWLLKH